jgi:hypothetical protein
MLMTGHSIMGIVSLLGRIWLYNLLLPDDRLRRALGVSSVERSVEPSGGFQNVSERWIVIQREQKCKAICVCTETMPDYVCS